MNRPDLDKRLRRILTFVVESHVTRAEPVGSQYVRAAYHLSISPATIRNAMQHLEEMGLLGHPHTSAGRVPTEAGYRYYVDELMRPEPIAPAAKRALDEAAGADDIPAVLARAARQLALFAFPAREERTLARVDLVALQDGLVVLAAGDSAGAVKTTTWRPERAAAPPDLREAESWIRARLPLAVPSGVDALIASLPENAPEALRFVIGEALTAASELLSARSEPAVRLDGAEHIAAQPEFQEPERLRPLVSLLAKHEALARALDAFMDEAAPRVSIGSENEPAAIRSCSIVGIGVVVGGKRGVLGVMGPVRMPYRRVVSLVSYAGGQLAGA